MQIHEFLYRIRHRCQRFYFNEIEVILNRIEVYLAMGQYRSDINIRGKLRCSVGRHAIFSIGKCLRMDNTLLFNPLSSKPGIINVSGGAKLIIGNNVGMSSPTILVRKGVTIHDNVNLGGQTIIMDTDAHSLSYLDRRNISFDNANRKDKEVVIGRDVFIGANCIILKGVHIGEMSVIGAGSIVTKDIPPKCIAAGNPCRVMKFLDD